MRNRFVKKASKHFDKETLDRLLIDYGCEGLKEKNFYFSITSIKNQDLIIN